MGAAVCGLGFGGELLDANRWPGLATHYARMKARASLQSVLPGEQRTVAKLSGQA